MASITINNQTFSGNNISISGSKITIDGKDVTPDQKQISIVIEGDVHQVSADVCDKLTVNGNSGAVSTMSGDIDIKGNVTGNVKTMSGDVECGNISGDVTTMSGNVKKR